MEIGGLTPDVLRGEPKVRSSAWFGAVVQMQPKPAYKRRWSGYASIKPKLHNNPALVLYPMGSVLHRMGLTPNNYDIQILKNKAQPDDYSNPAARARH